jgi:hypothetical protein
VAGRGQHGVQRGDRDDPPAARLLRYVNTTCAPSAASRRTIAAPIPLVPPVTRAVRPVSVTCRTLGGHGPVG